MAAQQQSPPPTPKPAPTPAAAQNWVDLVCTGACNSLLKSNPTIYAWRSPVVLYIILFVSVCLVMIYKAITRRLSASPEAPLASGTSKTEAKAKSPEKPKSPAAPKSPRTRAPKKTAPPPAEPEPEPVVSPKGRRGRKSVSNAEVAPVPVTYVFYNLAILTDDGNSRGLTEVPFFSTRRASLAPKSPKGRARAVPESDSEHEFNPIAQTRYVSCGLSEKYLDLTKDLILSPSASIWLFLPWTLLQQDHQNVKLTLLLA